MFVAVADDTIIGTTTLRTWEMDSEDSSAAELAFQRVLGVWGALRSIFALSLLDTVEADFLVQLKPLAALFRAKLRAAGASVSSTPSSTSHYRAKRRIAHGAFLLADCVPKYFS